MTVNKGLLFVGIILAILGVAGVFLFAQIVNPEPVLVVVAHGDLEKGTRLADLPKGTLSQARGDAALIGSYLTVAKYTDLAQAGAVLAENITSGQAIPLSAILSADNPASRKYASLLLDDPNMTAMTIDAKGIVPSGVRAGDMVDIVVAVDNIRDNGSTQDESMFFGQPQFNSAGEMTGIATPEAAGTPIPGAQPALPGARPTEAQPTATREPYMVPLAKRVIHNAMVTNVVREQKNSTGVDGNTQIIYGEISGLTVIVPRDQVEWLTMANKAGQLRIALLSPMADESDTVTNGASVQDLIEKYYEDRATLQPTMHPATPTPGQ